GDVPAPRLESATLLVVDDNNAAPLARRVVIRSSAAACRSRLRHELTRGDDESRRTVRRPAAGSVARLGRPLADRGSTSHAILRGVRVAGWGLPTPGITPSRVTRASADR